MNNDEEEFGIYHPSVLLDTRAGERNSLPGTMTISFFRVLSLSSFTSSNLSIPSVKAFAPATNAKTMAATSSALLPLVLTAVLLVYSPSVIISSVGSPAPREFAPSPTIEFCEGNEEEVASKPVLRMIEPSDLERMRVD